MLRAERADYLRQLTRRLQHEVPFSDLPDPVIDQLHTLDVYPSDRYLFDVYGHQVPIENDRLVQALLELGAESYSILLLSSLCLSDRQIAALLGSSKSTIQRRRNRLMDLLRTKMKE